MEREKKNKIVIDEKQFDLTVKLIVIMYIISQILWTMACFILFRILLPACGI